MKKRKGMALISVLILLFVGSILSISILNVYLSSVKQQTSDYNYSELEYMTFSGLNISASFIINKNDEFMSQYNSFLTSGNNRQTPFEVTFSASNNNIVTGITSVVTSPAIVLATEGNTVISKEITTYTLKSVGTDANVKMSNMSVDITQVDIIQTTTNGNNKVVEKIDSTFSMSEYY